MARAESYRQLVEARAGGSCEYCRLIQSAAGVTFHIEHVRPRSRRGRTMMSILAVSCPGCNLAKAGRVSGKDQSGRTWRLFNPRDYNPWLLGWHLHFMLDRTSGVIRARTRRSEATVSTLRMNDAVRVFARKLQIVSGLIA
jgi:HNH endonuclease